MHKSQVGPWFCCTGSRHEKIQSINDSTLSFCVALHLPVCLPVQVGQRAGCCPASGSLASGHGPGTSVSAERGGRCDRGWHRYGYGQCDLWHRWTCRDGPWSRRCPPPRSPPGPAPTEQPTRQITEFKQTSAELLSNLKISWCRSSPWTLPGGPGCAGGPCSQTYSRCAWFCAGRCDRSPQCCLCSPGNWAACQWCHKPVLHLSDCPHILTEEWTK